MAKANEVKSVKGSSETDVMKEVKTVVETKAEETKAPVRAEETKAPVKAEETKAEETKAPAKKAPAKKTTTKKTTTKKNAAAKSTTTRSKKEAVYIEFDGKQIAVSELLENAKANYTGGVKNVKELNIYVNSDNKKAYVVVNGEQTGEMDL